VSLLLSQLGGAGTQTVIFTGLLTQTLTGTPQVNLVITPDGLLTQTLEGSPQVNLVIQPNSLLTQTLFGTPQVNFIIQPNGLITHTFFGTVTVDSGTAFADLPYQIVYRRRRR
jgi:hypothetical protein